MAKRAFASPFHDFCQEQRPLLPADLKGSEKEQLLGQRWQALSPAAKAKRKVLIPVFTCGRGGARTWVPATLEPEAAVEDLMTFVLMGDVGKYTVEYFQRRIYVDFPCGSGSGWGCGEGGRDAERGG